MISRVRQCLAAAGMGVALGTPAFFLWNASAWIPLLPAGVLLTAVCLVVGATIAALIWHAWLWPEVRAGELADEQAAHAERQWKASAAQSLPTGVGPPGTRRCACPRWVGPYQLVCFYCASIVWKLAFAVLMASALVTMALLSKYWVFGPG